MLFLLEALLLLNVFVIADNCADRAAQETA